MYIHAEFIQEEARYAQENGQKKKKDVASWSMGMKTKKDANKKFPQKVSPLPVTKTQSGDKIPAPLDFGSGKDIMVTYIV